MTTRAQQQDHGRHGGDRGDSGHAGYGGHGGHRHGQHGGHATASGRHGHMADAQGIAVLLSDERRAKMPPEETLRAVGIAQGQTVVDLGCGPGFFTLPATGLVGPAGKVYGVDVQPEMVEACRQRAAEAGARQVEVVRSSEAHVPLPDGIADLVLASVVLHEAKDRAAFLREARRLLRPDGEVAVIEFRKEEGTPGPPLERRLSEGDVAAVAEAAGLRVRAQRALNEQLFLSHLAAA